MLLASFSSGIYIPSAFLPATSNSDRNADQISTPKKQVFSAGNPIDTLNAERTVHREFH
jgi:hypothetical protein